MRTLTCIALALALAGCGDKNVRQPKLPETVSIAVEKYRELPAWAFEQHVVPMPADGTVEARVQSNNDRGDVIAYDNCLHRLLATLVAGGTADPKECAK